MKKSKTAPIFKIVDFEERISFNKAQYDDYRLKLKNKMVSEQEAVVQTATQHLETKELAEKVP